MGWEITGHDWAVELLKGHLVNNQVRHAYLISGPSGVGRRTLAIRLAQALNCQTPVAPGEPCLQCRSCTTIERMQHPDLSVVQAEQVGGVLRVDQVRALQRELALAPYEARYRVALLLRFEEAHVSACNALLKTLEEPNPSVVLIITAESTEALLPTVVSRCEVLRLRPVPFEQVAEFLTDRWGVPQEQAKLLSHISGGRIGQSLALYRSDELLQARKDCLDELGRLLSASRVERFAYADAISKDKAVLREFLSVWLSYWRDVMLRSSGADVPVANLDREVEIERLSDILGLEKARMVVAAIQRTLTYIDQYVNNRLALEVLMLDLPRVEQVG